MSSVYKDSNGNLLFFNGGLIEAPNTADIPTNVEIPSDLSNATAIYYLRVNNNDILYCSGSDDGLWLYDSGSQTSTKISTARVDLASYQGTYVYMKVTGHILISGSNNNSSNKGLWSYDVKQKTLTKIWNGTYFNYIDYSRAIQLNNGKYILQAGGSTYAQAPFLLYDPITNSATTLIDNNTGSRYFGYTTMPDGDILFYPSGTDSSYIFYLFNHINETMTALNDSSTRYSTSYVTQYKLDNNMFLYRNTSAYNGLFNYVIYDNTTKSLNLIYSEDTQVNGNGTYYFQKLKNHILMGSSGAQYPLRSIDIINKTVSTLYTSELTSGTFTWRFLNLTDNITLMTVALNGKGIFRYDEDNDIFEEITTTNTLNSYLHKMTDNTAVVCGNYISIYNDNTKTATNSSINKQFDVSTICKNKLILLGSGICAVDISNETLSLLYSSGTYREIFTFDDCVIIAGADSYYTGIYSYNPTTDTVTKIYGSGYNWYKKSSINDNEIIIATNSSSMYGVQNTWTLKYNNTTKQITFYAVSVR